MATDLTQDIEIDFENFSPLVVKFTSIRLLLAIIARLDLKLYQMIVKITFLKI